MNRHPRLLVYLLLSAFGLVINGQAGEILYNGIPLPDLWPPNALTLSDPAPVPYYLKYPPAVITIDVGRQFFIDDFLIASTSLSREWHEATWYRLNPIIPIDRPWEEDRATDPTESAVNEVIPSAMTFAGGVWYDPKEKLFKMFYHVIGRYLCLATSTDGIKWAKPDLDVRPGTNIVLAFPRDNKGDYEETDAGLVWLDATEKDPAKRFKALFPLFADKGHGALGMGLTLRYSMDGRRWSDRILTRIGYGDGGAFFYNPFRKVWVLGLRDSAQYFGWETPYRKTIEQGKDRQIRIRRYHEGSDLLSAYNWGTTPYLDTIEDGRPGVDRTVKWLRADSRDEHFPGPKDKRVVLPGIYDVQVNAYESIMLGTFSIIPGWYPDGVTKMNYGSIGFSRDGFTFDRPNRAEFLQRGLYGDWNTGYLHPAGGVCLVVGDKLYFYAGARQPVANNPRFRRQYNTGLAVLRRDGFASMDAGLIEGILTTRPVRFKGKYLFANFDAPKGGLRVEVLDERNQVIEPFSLANSISARGDSTAARLSWNGADDLSAVAGRPVRFRFYLTNGKLYSFWVSPSISGASYGYVAAGGPGFAGPIDTVGNGQ